MEHRREIPAVPRQDVGKVVQICVQDRARSVEVTLEPGGTYKIVALIPA